MRGGSKMKDEREKELMDRLRKVENALQEGRSDTKRLKSVINDLRDIIQALDKDHAIHAEKFSHLYYRVEELSKEISKLEGKGDKTNEKQRDLMENALMVILGGLITYFFSTLRGGGE
jgi:chromosome segregation ATPase